MRPEAFVFCFFCVFDILPSFWSGLYERWFQHSKTKLDVFYLGLVF